MPISAPYAIPVVIHAARQVQPRSILDVGVGFGKYGMLFRECLDIWDADRDCEPRLGEWRLRMDGVEIFPSYLTALHDFLYDRIHVGNIVDVIDRLGQYDLIFAGDVIEHLAKDDGRQVVRKLYEHANKCVLLTYPSESGRRGAMFKNRAEAHRSDWDRADFRDYPDVAYTVVENRAEICAIPKPPQPAPFLVACLGARRREGWKGKLASAVVKTVGPSLASSLATKILRRPIVLRAE